MDDLKEKYTPQEVRDQAYERSCMAVLPGHLNAYDVCRLWGNDGSKEWVASPGKSATALIEELGLPLLQLGAGRWVVAHALEDEVQR